MASPKRSAKSAPKSPSSTEKQAPKKSASKAPAKEVATLRESTDTAARVGAVIALEKKLDDDATRAILFGALSRDEPVRVASLRALATHLRLREARKKPFDLVPAFREGLAMLAAEGQGLGPDEARAARDRSPASSFLANLMNTLQNEVATRQDVREALRELAWGPSLGSASESAQSILAFKGDPDSIERASRLLGVYSLRSAAAWALYSLDPEVAIERAKEQLAALEGPVREEAARTLIGGAHYRAKHPWKPLLASLAKEFSSLRSEYESWANSLR